MLTRNDDDHHLRAGIEPVEDLLLDLRVGVAGRDYLDRQIRRLGPEARDFPDRFDPSAAHEGYIRRAHGVGGSGELEPRFGGVNGPEPALFDILRKAPGEAHRHTSVHVSCRVNPQQLSLYELVAEPVVGHEQQIICGNLLTYNVHALILTIADL